MAEIVLAVAQTGAQLVASEGVRQTATSAIATAVASTVASAARGFLDQRLFGSGSRVVSREGPRLTDIDVQTSSEGAPVPRVWGRMRLAGQIIWATDFKEVISVDRTTTGGGGGGGKGIVGGGGGGGGTTIETTTYSYSCSFAVGLCEGPITGIGGIWADGKPLVRDGGSLRVHLGTDTQAPDPLIAAVQTDAPAFRGTAYLVFEDLPLARFGNRLPQLTVEVRRAPDASVQDGPPLPEIVEAVALSPGSGEFALATEPVRRVLGEGEYAPENQNNATDQTDIAASLDQLEASLPAARSVLLVVSWFGTDLRAGFCEIRPGIDRLDKATEPQVWSVSGIARSAGHVISTDEEGNANFGGTPSDLSVVQAIAEMRARGIKVVFYPFLLMDIPEGNGLPNPYGGGAQPVFPWRGRITLDAAPGQPGTADKTAAAASDVSALFGAATQAEFGAWTGESLPFSGSEWSLRRMILHYAHLCEAAGGVDAFCIGSEMRGLTTIRSGASAYPAVEEFRALARDVRAVLRPSTKIGYAADWSEYFGHHPQDGSGDVHFHLDPLWADSAIDFVGIDNYMPLSDWRYSADHADAAAGSVYDLDYLAANVEGGELGEWFYASDAARAAQDRTPITDGAHGEPWVFAPKRLREWWGNRHHNRPGGVRSATPTAWVPQSKPIWFTELGCPAVDLGANQPNVFVDPKSSESAVPYFSRGIRDDMMQRRFLQASLDHWQDAANNPASSVYSGRMIDTSRTHVWTWDARPYPDFPVRASVWSDGGNYQLGHWLTGRIDAASLAETVAELCEASGEPRVDVSELVGLIDGYMLDRNIGARDALSPLMRMFGFDAVESGGMLRFVPRGAVPQVTLDTASLVVDGPAEAVSLTRAQSVDLPRAVRLNFARSDAEYRVSAAEASLEPAPSQRVESSDLPVAMTASTADAIVRRWLQEVHVARDGAVFALPPSRLALEPTDTVGLAVDGSTVPFRLDRVTSGAALQVEATRTAPSVYAPVAGSASPPPEPDVGAAPSPVLLEVMDLPLLTGEEVAHQPRLAATAAPWPGGVSVYRSATESDFRIARVLAAPATMGRTATDLEGSAPGLWSGTSVEVQITGDTLLSRDPLSVLAGANTAALKTPEGDWEVFQYREAVLLGTGRYRLSGLLRGQAGTEHLVAASLPSGSRIVILDGTVAGLPLAETEIGLIRAYRYGPSGQSFEAETYRALDFTARGVGLRPYAPAHLRLTSGPDRVATWLRRTRRGGDPWDREVPLSETTERYRVEIRDATGAVLRSAETTAESYAYTAAQAAADPAAAILAVAQISEAVGPGPFATVEMS